MKKLYFFLLAMILPVSMWAQATSAYSLRVQNQTPLPQQYTLFGGEVCGPCASTYSSVILTIAPMSTISYPNTTTVPGYPATPKSMTGAKILNGPVICSPGGGTVGQPGCGLPLTYVFTTLDPSCNPAFTTRADWIPVTNCQGTAQLIFRP